MLGSCCGFVPISLILGFHGENLLFNEALQRWLFLYPGFRYTRGGQPDGLKSAKMVEIVPG